MTITVLYACNDTLPCSIPPTSLLYGTRYDKLAGAFGAQGYHAETIPELNQALLKAFRDNVLCPVIINVVVHPNSSRKAQVLYIIIIIIPTCVLRMYVL